MNETTWTLRSRSSYFWIHIPSKYINWNCRNNNRANLFLKTQFNWWWQNNLWLEKFSLRSLVICCCEFIYYFAHFGRYSMECVCVLTPTVITFNFFFFFKLWLQLLLMSAALRWNALHSDEKSFVEKKLTNKQHHQQQEQQKQFWC